MSTKEKSEVVHQDTITCPNCLKQTLDRIETKEDGSIGFFKMSVYKAKVQCSNLHCRWGWENKGHYKPTFNREAPKIQLDLSEYV